MTFNLIYFNLFLFFPIFVPQQLITLSQKPSLIHITFNSLLSQ